MQIRRTSYQRGPRASAILLCGILAVLFDPCATSKPQDESSRAVQLCWERLIDAVRNLSDIQTFDPVEKRVIRVHDDESARPAIVSSSRLLTVTRRSEVYEVVNRSSPEGPVIDCCRIKCTLEELIRYGASIGH